MPAEKFANRPAAEVAVAYTATDLTLEVDDASPFPTTGVFRVILGNTEQTIFRVDSVAGNVFTGAAEAFDGNAAIGVTVKIVASKAVGERFIQAPTAGEVQAYAGVAGADRYGPIWKLEPVVAADFSWVNQGAAVETVADGIAFLSITGGATNISKRVMALPATPFSVRALMIPQIPTAAADGVGLLFRESATSKILGVRFTAHNKFDAATSAAGILWDVAVGTSVTLNPFVIPFWLHLGHDGTTLTLGYSLDGRNVILLATRAKTTDFTTEPNQIGYWGNPQSASVHVSVLSFEVS